MRGIPEKQLFKAKRIKKLQKFTFGLDFQY